MCSASPAAGGCAGFTAAFSHTIEQVCSACGHDIGMPGAPAYLAFAIAALGMAVRGILSALSTGTNDIILWDDFAHYASLEGVLWMYRNVPAWNHPPLTGYLAGLASCGYPCSRVSVFPSLFKLVPMAADALCLVLLWKIWRRRSAHPAAPLAAVAIFAFSPDAILVSAYHGNNDPLVGLFVLAACYFVEERASFAWAGVALAAAINVKLIPLLLVPVFVANVRRWRDAARFVGGLSLGAVPFVPVILRVGPAFYRNAIAYNSNFDNWGIPFFIRLLEENARVDRGRGTTSRALRTRRPVPGGCHHPGPLRVEPVAPSAVDVSACRRRAGRVPLPRSRLRRPVHGHPGPRSHRRQPGLGPLVRRVGGRLPRSVYYLFWTRQPLLGSLFTSAFPGISPWIGLVAWVGIGEFALSLFKVQGSGFMVQGSGEPSIQHSGFSNPNLNLNPEPVENYLFSARSLSASYNDRYPLP